MNYNEVVDAINTLRKFKSETNRIEAKTASDGFPKKCYDTISSFSNKYGGIIIFGINEEKGSVIENRHSGIPTMRREMKKMNLPEPEFIEERGSFKVIFRNSFSENENYLSFVEHQSGQQTSLIDRYKEQVLDYCYDPKSAKEISEYLQIKSRTYISTYIIKPLINDGKLEYTNKNSIMAKNQKYKTVK